MAEDIHEIQDRHAEENGKSDYGAKDIRVLEGLEAVRMRPGMYIGSTSARGLHPRQNALVGSDERAVDIDGHKTDSHSRLPRYHKIKLILSVPSG